MVQLHDIHSILLLVLVNAKYTMLWTEVIDAVGHPQIHKNFNHSALRNKLQDGSIGMPKPEPGTKGGQYVYFFRKYNTFAVASKAFFPNLCLFV